MSSVECIHREDEYDPFEHRKVEKPTSTIGTFIHMIKGSLGTGIMAMPLAFKNGGLIFGAIGTVVICVIYTHCVHLLVGTSQKACKKGEIPVLGYAETVHAVFSDGPSKVRRIAKFTSAVLFAIQGIRYVLPIENKMKQPQHFLFRFGVLNLAMTFLISLYSVTGFFGYAQYGEKTEGSVTLNLPEDNPWAESTRLLSGIGIMFSLGLSYYVPMDILWNHMHQRLSKQWHNWGQIIVRFTMLVILAAVAIGAPEISPFVGLVGSFGSSTLAILIPVALDVIFRWPSGFGRMKWMLWKDVVLFVFGMFILVAGTYFSLKDIVAIYE